MTGSQTLAILALAATTLSWTTEAFLMSPMTSLRRSLLPSPDLAFSSSRNPLVSFRMSDMNLEAGNIEESNGIEESAVEEELQPGVEQKGLVTVYYKEGCPHCVKALGLLEDVLGLEVNRVNVLEGEDSEEKIRQMKTFSGRNTVPQVFFNSDHIGGNDDLLVLNNNRSLPALVEKVRAEAPGTMRPNWFHPWY